MDKQDRTTMPASWELKNFLTSTDLVVYLSILLVTWFVYYLVFRPMLSPLYKIPGKRGSLLLGSVSDNKFIGLDPSVYFLTTMKELNVKKIFRVHWLLGWASVCIASPDVYKYVSVLNNKNYPKASLAYQSLVTVFGKGILVLNGEEHAVQRKLCLGAFKYNVLKSLVGKFDNHGKELVKMWDEHIGKSDNADMFVEKDINRAAFDSIADACFDWKTSVLQDHNNELSRAVMWLMGSVNDIVKSLIPYYRYIPTPENIKFNRYKKLVDNAVSDMIERRRTFVQTLKDDSKVDNLLTMLLLAEDEEDGTRLSNTQIRDHILTFLFAGHETSAGAMLWCLWSLALNPRVQQKVRDEIISVLHDPDEAITADHLDRMPYLSCVIKETLRTHSPVPLTVRVAQNDDYIDGHFIPQGTYLFLLICALHNNPEYWEDPEKFYPERFQDESKIKPFTFIPFASGPRMCIGYKLAMMEMQVFVANMLRKFEFSPTPGMENVGRYFFSVQKPLKPILLKVTRLRQME